MYRTIGLIVLMAGGHAYGQRYILLDYENGDPVGGTLTVGMQSIGDPAITSILSGSVNDLSGNLSETMRDSWVPPEGIEGVAKRAVSNLPQNAAIFRPGVQLFFDDSVQFWASTNGTDWTLLKHGTSTDITVSSANYKLYEFGNVPTPTTASFNNVPALGSIGLVVLICGLMAAGGNLARRNATTT